MKNSQHKKKESKNLPAENISSETKSGDSQRKQNDKQTYDQTEQSSKLPDENPIQIENEYESIRNKVLSLVEIRLLNSQSQVRSEMEHALYNFDKTLTDTLKEVREKQLFDLSKHLQENKSYFNEKVFRFKESPLTEYFKIENYRTLYNMAVATLIALIFNLNINEYISSDIFFDLDTLHWCFNNYEKIFMTWNFVFLLNLLVIPFVEVIIRKKIPKFIWIPIYSAQILLQIYIGAQTCLKHSLGAGSGMIVMCEAVRMVMKGHAYLRTKLLYCTDNPYKLFIPEKSKKQGFTEKQLQLPNIDLKDISLETKRYLYFFFSPTLIYRDEYIMAPKREIKMITLHFINFFLCIYFGFIIFKTFCKPQIHLFSKNISFQTFLQVCFQLMLPGTLSIILLFFGVLHSWMNGWAELLRFPDRTFYLDWWNSREFGTYYRKWNIVIHEWLFYYVYGDISRFSLGLVSKTMTSIWTFIISAVIHELIISCMLGFFYPMLFVIFAGPGFILMNQQTGKGGHNRNIVFWLLMYIGTSLILTLYLTEYYSRYIVDNHFVEQRWGILSAIIPRTIYLRYF